MFHFDSKVFRTAKLLLRPGELTRRLGHRLLYVPPIGPYVLTSFVFLYCRCASAS
ncbi:DUF3667 domain-containing protein [Hymenobacter elongatus]|uniref:DUF3667 domain-containing protein n=1 Tax=Hymenobacter elongatus TaxID=877208 RepID=UPI0037439F83